MAPAGIAGLFDRVADTYDAVGVDWFGPIAAGLVEELSPAPGERALDVGCGKGAALLPLARSVGATGAVTGVDLAPRMVQAAREASRAAGLGHVAVLVGDAVDLPVPEASFDVVASSLVLFFMPEPAAALAGWVRALRPGGRIGIATFADTDPVWQQVDRLFEPYLPQRMLDARTSGRSGPFAEDASMERLLGEAGCTDVRTARRTVVAEMRDAEHWHAFSWSHGQRAMWECVPDEERAAVRASATELLGAAARPDGGIGLRQEVRYTLGTRPS